MFPTIDDLLTVRTIGGAQISPDGSRVAYTASETDFAQDAFVTHVWIADTATGRTYQLTRGDKTLIQNGELDRRVPIPNAYELRQGLEDRGLPVEMVVYKGFGHGITKPRAMRAVMQHNLAWFNHYLWGDPKPDFTAPDVPKRKKNEGS